MRFGYFAILAVAAIWVQVCEPVDADDPQVLRVATFNVAMHRSHAGRLATDLRGGDDKHAHSIAEVIQAVSPDILLLNEFDFDAGGQALKYFQELYLRRAHGTRRPIDYLFHYVNEVNTGVPSGQDLNRNQKYDEAADAFGFGQFPGQYGMVVLSKYPIVASEVRTFREFLWRDLPDAALPQEPGSNRDYYAPQALAVFRLSSKSHWDVPIQVGSAELHLLACHPTPPVFDGPEDRNGRRNHDEIRFFADYVHPARSAYVRDDRGRTGGLKEGRHFVIAGDLNADPNDGDSFRTAARQLTEHPLINPLPIPSSEGAAAAAQTKANSQHKGDPRHDTGDFRDDSVGNLRVDYVLPSNTMTILRAEVYWPSDERVVNASDHRLVWIDIRLPLDDAETRSPSGD